MEYLKQSTAIEVKLGPFLDSTDGVTPETALTITQADVRLAKGPGDWAQKNEATSLVHEENGWYRCLLDATDTATLGTLKLAILESGALPVWETYTVLEANVYDSLIGGGSFLSVNLAFWLGAAPLALSGDGAVQGDLYSIGGSNQSQVDLKDFADAGYDPATNKVEGVKLADVLTTYTGNTPQTGDVFPLASTEIADIKAKTDQLVFTTANRVDATAVTVSDKTGYALSVAGIAAIWDALLSGMVTVGSVGKRIADNLDATVNSRSSHSAADVWASGSRTLTSFGTLVADVWAAVSRTITGTVTVGTNNDKTGYALSSAGVDAVLDDEVETGVTLRQSLRLANSANAGKTNGALGPTFNMRDIADTKDRVSATVDADGNRTAITRDLT